MYSMLPVSELNATTTRSARGVHAATGRGTREGSSVRKAMAVTLGTRHGRGAPAESC